jgi:hypothetical protein
MLTITPTEVTMNSLSPQTRESPKANDPSDFPPEETGWVYYQPSRPPPAKDVRQHNDDEENIPLAPQQDGTSEYPIIIDDDACEMLDHLSTLQKTLKALEHQVKDPVSHTLLKTPYVATDGHTYDLETIKKCRESPMTRESPFHEVTPNLFAKQIVDIYADLVKEYKCKTKQLNTIVQNT